MRLVTLNSDVATATAKYNSLHAERLALEDRVIRLRPATLDRDLLEERARVVLGFGYPDERIIMTAGSGAITATSLN